MRKVAVAVFAVLAVGAAGCSCGGTAPDEQSQAGGCEPACGANEQCQDGTCFPTGSAPVESSIEIGPAVLPEAQAGQAYQQSLSAVGGVAPYQYALAAGTLPVGLALTPEGTVSGTPVEPGAADFSVLVTDASSPPRTATRSFQVTVAPAPLLLGGSLPIGQVAVAYSAALEASGGVAPYQFRFIGGGQPPPGLVLEPNGTLSGTPTVAGTTRFTLEVTDSGAPQQSVSALFVLAIRTAAGDLPLEIVTETLPEGALGQPYAVRIEATGGQTPYLFALESGTVLPEGLVLSLDGEIAGTPTRAGTYELIVQVEDGAATSQLATRSFRLVIQPASGDVLAFAPGDLPDAWVGQPYAAQLAAAGGTEPYRFGLTAESQLPPGLYVDATGAVRGTPFATGTFALTAAVWDSSDPYQMATRPLSITVRSEVAGGQLWITSLTLRKAKVGQNYRNRLTASGGSGNFVWELMFGQLPPGLALDSSGLLSGTTAVQGNFPVTVAVQDAADPNLRTQTTLVVRTMATGAAGLRFQMSPYLEGRVNSPYLQTVRLRAGVAPFTFALSGAPAGIEVAASASDPTAGALSGVPAVSGVFHVTVVATETRLNGDTATRYDLMTVQPDPSGVQLSTSMVPQGKVGLPYAVQLGAFGGSGAYRFATAGGTALPAGLVLEAGGLISGTPAAYGATAVIIEAMDGTGQSASAQYWFEVAP